MTFRGHRTDAIKALDAAEKLRAAFAQSQAADVGDMAHKLKSSARWVGALRLGDVLEMMEETASSGQIKDLRDLFVRFEVELAQVEAAFQQSTNGTEN